MNKKLKALFFVLYDVMIVAFSWFISILFVNGAQGFGDALSKSVWFLVGAFALVIILNQVLGLYTKLWQYANIIDAMKIVLSSLAFAVYLAVTAIILKQLNVAWAFIVVFLYFVLILSSRFFTRLYLFYRNNSKGNSSADKIKRIMIVGAGEAASQLIIELQKKQSEVKIVCAVDDDKNKVGLELHGVRVLGTCSDIEDLSNKYGINQIVIAMPAVSRNTISRIVKECQKTNCSVKTVPSIYKLATGDVSVSNIKDVEINDLLGREPIKINLSEIVGYIEERVVLVTGGGGSIGSELCRQIAMHNPKQLIILDIYENNAYDIQQELKRKMPYLNLTVLIASVRDKEKIDDVFKKYQPDIVFHAAAHKHVPLMETSPNEAVKNNVGGTYNVADAAGRFGAKRFILISTDKAVNPTNVMGATKRICEMIIQAMDSKYKTEYVAVRFGNVLGSNGSVVPLFKKQIAEGGPITVTHKEIVRYFMTIPEAVSLVLQAGAYANGGEIFVLDMGEPIKIYDLAIQLIKLSGFEPFSDIEVKVTGLRPGEKLFEERLMAEEGLKKTPNRLISIGKPLVFDKESFFDKVKKLIENANAEADGMKDLVQDLVPTYKIDRNE